MYGSLPPKNIAELKPWDMVHVDLKRPYVKSIRKHHQGGATIKIDACLTCMNMIYLAAGGSKIVKVMVFELDSLTERNN